MAKTVEFLLSEPLMYSTDGEKQSEQVLNLLAPHFGSAIVKKNARRLKQLAFQALLKAGQASKDMSGNSEPSDKKEAELGSLFQAFFLSDVDVNPICDAMKDLAPAVVRIGESKEFKAAHWDKLSLDDQERLTGAYIESFLMR